MNSEFAIHQTIVPSAIANQRIYRLYPNES